MFTANGAKFPTTATSGSRITAPIGRLIATEPGSTSLSTAGRGFPMSHGVGRLTTTAAGLFTAGGGAGGRVPCTHGIVRFGRALQSPPAGGVVVGSAFA